MGLSFPKQVERSHRVRVRYIVTEKFANEDGLIQPSFTERRTFHARHEAEKYAESRPGVVVGALTCYVAVLSTEYTGPDHAA